MAEPIDVAHILHNLDAAERAIRALRISLTEIPPKQAADLPAVLALCWDELPVLVRTQNCLRNEIGEAGTVADILRIREGEWLRTPNFGRKSLYDLRDALKAFGLRLRP